MFNEILIQKTFIFTGSNQKLRIIVTLLNKKYKRRLVSLAGFCSQIQIAKQKLTSHALLERQTEACCVYYSNKLILEVLKILKIHGFIFSYYQLPLELFEGYLTCKKFFKPQLIIVFFNYSIFGEGNALQRLTLLSSQSRQKFLTKNECLKIILDDGKVSPLYVLSTVFGLLTLQQSIQKRVGGKLLLCIK
jgi:ribosomal protein S8